MLQGHYAKITHLFWTLYQVKLNEHGGSYEVVQNVICSGSMCNEYHNDYLISSNSHIAIVMYKSYLFPIMASWTVTNSQTSRDEVILNIYYDQCRNRTDNLKLELNLRHILSPI